MANARSAMRTPLGKARGHGAGHGGTGHFIAQRVSAVALLILAPWLAVSLALAMKDVGPTAAARYEAANDFLNLPINAVGVMLFVVAALYHMRLGMQVIIEDYVAKPVAKALLLIANTLIVIAFGAGAIFAVLAVNFGA